MQIHDQYNMLCHYVPYAPLFLLFSMNGYFFMLIYGGH